VAAKKKLKQHKAGLKDKGVLVRVSKAQKEELTKAAKNAGMGLSTWMLTHALLAAQQAQWRGEALRKKRA
jgi:uncharacterized protein (DUF1778 family)